MNDCGMNSGAGATSRRTTPPRIMRWANRVCASLAVGFGLCAVDAAAATVDVRVSDTRGTPVKDALIVLDPLDASPTPAHNTAVVDQVNQAFVPHISVVRTGTAISFPNSDRIRHQVYSFSAAKTFTIKLYAGSPDVPITVDKPGLIVLGCNIHDSMAGFVAVVDTPYFGKSSPQGSVRIEVPSGHYRLRVWHENESKPFQSTRISVDGAALELPIELEITDEPGIAAPWPE